jgi:carbonic anhydrase
MNRRAPGVWQKDVPASISVFLVAVPLCLGIAIASDVPPLSGLIAGIVGGIVVGWLSGSHTSVAGPAAGLVAIVLAAQASLGSFDRFLMAVALSGILQLGLGAVRAGGIAHYFPNAVIRGLLAAIGLILILKEIPHALGYDVNADNDFAFLQADGNNTFSDLLNAATRLEPGAILITLVCLAVLLGWQRSERLRKLPVPAPLAAVVIGIAVNALYQALAPQLWLTASHRVSLPTFSGLGDLFGSLPRPDLGSIADMNVWRVAVTLAVVASLETLLNLEAADKLDRHRRVSPPNRELFAQGIANVVSGSLGGLPVTSVVVRSSVNVYAGAESRLSSILHGVWLIVTVLLIPGVLGLIPLSALAAILIVTGAKLASPQIFLGMWRRGWSQFLPFAATVVAIVFTDLLIGIVIGLTVGIAFVIRGLLTTPFLVRTPAKPAIGQPARMKLVPQVSFLHRARLVNALENVPPDTDLVIDASNTHTLDADVVDILRNFRDVQSKERNIRLSMVGFDGRMEGAEPVTYVDVFTQARQRSLSPDAVLRLLEEGNQRFFNSEQLERDFRRQVQLTSNGQHPIAAVLGCIDSRAPAEIVFDKGIGDMFSVRVAGNVLNDDVIGSLEYAAQVAQVKLILVLGHTRCGAVCAACNGVELGHVTGLLDKLRPSVDAVRETSSEFDPNSHDIWEAVARDNVRRVIEQLPQRSLIIRELVDKGELALAGGLYFVEDGRVEFITRGAKLYERRSAVG